MDEKNFEQVRLRRGQIETIVTLYYNEKDEPVKFGFEHVIVLTEEEVRVKIEEMKVSITEAVESQDFERAAKLRDNIKALEDKIKTS